MFIRLFLVIVFSWVAGFTLVAPATAHTLRPAIVDLRIADGSAQVSISANAEALLSGIGPEHDNSEDAPQAERYDTLRALAPEALATHFADFEPGYRERLTLRVDDARLPLAYRGIDIPKVADVRDARLSTIRYAATLPAGARSVVVSYPAEYGDAVIRLQVGERETESFWLTGGEATPPVVLGDDAVPASLLDNVVRYTVLGFTHIVPLGADHILFVLGLFLLSLHWRPLLWQITAFTVAHTLTLALSIYGVVAVPATIVEPLIAASIAYVGVENLLTRRLHTWRILVVFAFGLLHGLGFGGVLLQLGLPREDFVAALIAFNVGVELGQLAVVAAAFALVFLISRRADVYRRFVVIPGSLAISVAGVLWTIERL